MATGKKNKGPSLNEDVSQLEAEYVRERPRADRLVTCVKDEVTDLLARGDIALGVPVEARVKDWASIKEKIDRKSLSLKQSQISQT